MENNVILQVQDRIKTLLFDKTIDKYREHESFCSHSNQHYQFLIWKLPLEKNLQQFGKEIEQLVVQQGYQCIPGAWDVSAHDAEKKIGYKVVALYKPDTK
jgi:hypothetical protein